MKSIELPSIKVRAVIAIFGLALLICAIPHRATKVPGYLVVVVDTQGRALARTDVHQYVQDYSSGVNVDRSADVLTDTQGNALFTPVIGTSSVLREFIGCAAQIASFGAHASCGSFSSIAVSDQHLFEVARSDQEGRNQHSQRLLRLTMGSCPSGDYWWCKYPTTGKP